MVVTFEYFSERSLSQCICFFKRVLALLEIFSHCDLIRVYIIRNILFKITKMYRLSRVIQAHKRDARCIDYFNGILVTGGSDKTFNMFSYRSGNCTHLMSSDIFDADILSIKINKNNPKDHIFVIIGCRNGEIFCFDRQGNPVFKLSHTSTISSLDFIDSDHIVSGSWDGKAIVWSLSQQKQVCQFKEHKHAVCVYYNRTNNYVVSGSQDKALNLWDWHTGMKIKRTENAHGDIIREISDIEGSGLIITCSNDEMVKIWSADLQPIQTLLGHTAFIFTVKALRLGFYVSGGQDKTLKFWLEDKCTQDVQLPASIWSIAIDENGDVLAAGSDGIIRTFSTDESRRADPDIEEMFNKQILQASSKKSGMNEEEIKKLLTTNQMNAIQGKKQGQIRVFRNGMVPEAYMWQGGKWVKIGDVITQGGGSGEMKVQQRYYPGDQYFQAGNYDYIFDVDDESGVPKTIPFNDGGNPMEAAQKYCRREGLTKGYLQQIRRFLIQNTSKIPRSTQKMSEQKQVSFGLLRCTPATTTIEFNDIKNPQALINKVKQFNEKAEGKRLNERQLAHIQRIAVVLENSKLYTQWTLDFKEMDAFKKLLSWPKEIKLPAWDMLRAFLKHYQSQSLFSGLEAGGDIITQLAIGLETEYPQGIYALILKTLSNILIQNTNKGGMLKHADIVFTSLLHITKRLNSKNASFLSGFASFLYNFSIACIQKNLEKMQVLDTLGDLIQRRLDLDSDQDNRNLLLQAGANILYKYHKTIKEKYSFLLKYLQGDDVSADIKVFY